MTVEAPSMVPCHKLDEFQHPLNMDEVLFQLWTAHAHAALKLRVYHVGEAGLRVVECYTHAGRTP